MFTSWVQAGRELSRAPAAGADGQAAGGPAHAADRDRRAGADRAGVGRGPAEGPPHAAGRDRGDEGAPGVRRSRRTVWCWPSGARRSACSRGRGGRARLTRRTRWVKSCGRWRHEGGRGIHTAGRERLRPVEQGGWQGPVAASAQVRGRRGGPRDRSAPQRGGHDSPRGRQDLGEELVWERRVPTEGWDVGPKPFVYRCLPLEP